MKNAEKIVKTKVGLLRLAEYLGNVSLACQIMGYSRDSFYRFKEQYVCQGEVGLQEINRSKPILKNRVAPELEEMVLTLSVAHPGWGQLRVSQELGRTGVSISPGGVRCIWLRHQMQTNLLRKRAALAAGN